MINGKQQIFIENNPISRHNHTQKIEKKNANLAFTILTSESRVKATENDSF